MKRRVFAAGLSIAGAIAVLVGANTSSWWTAREGRQTLSFGLRGLTSCLDGCGSVEYTSLARGDIETWLRAFIIFGRVAFYGAFVGALLALAAVVVAFTVKRRLPFTPGPVASAVNALLVVAAIAFIVARRGDGATLSLGYSMFLYILGAAASSVGCALLGGRPIIRPGYPAPISTGEAIPACPRCRAPMDWVAEHSRFYCAKCSLYV